jgi:hypothetical protein
LSNPQPPPLRVTVNYKEDGQFNWLKTNIDTPVDQRVLNSLVCEVAGWVAYFPGTDEPCPVGVVIGVGPFGWLETQIELNRPDVEEAQLKETGRQILTSQCGFSLLLPAYLVTSGGPYKVFVRCRDERQEILHEVAEISFSAASSVSWRLATAVQPLVVNSVGRSGSSLLCRILAMHHKIHVPTGGDQFGEISVCEYACRVASTLSSEGSYSALNRMAQLPDFHSVEAPHLCSVMLRNSGSSEYQHGPLQRTLTEGARMLASNILMNYTQFVQSDKPWLRYVAEKSWNSYNLNVLRLFFDAPREVFVVRKPSEFLRSQRAFLQKQGAKPEQIQRQHLATADRLGNLARSRYDRKDSSHVVKFEELISTPREVVASLMDYLGLESPEKYLASVVSIIGDDSSHSKMLRTERSDHSEDEYASYCANLSPSQKENLRMFCDVFEYTFPN